MPQFRHDFSQHFALKNLFFGPNREEYNFHASFSYSSFFLPFCFSLFFSLFLLIFIFVFPVVFFSFSFLFLSSSFSSAILAQAILAQGISVQTVRCTCEGWSVMELPADGWVKVLRGRRPPSEKATKNSTKVEIEKHSRGRWRQKPQVAQDKTRSLQTALGVLGPEDTAAKEQIQGGLRTREGGSSAVRVNPDTVKAETVAKVERLQKALDALGGLGGPEVDAIKRAALKKAQEVARERPIAELVKECKEFIERSTKRISKLKTELETETGLLEDSRAPRRNRPTALVAFHTQLLLLPLRGTGAGPLRGIRGSPCSPPSPWMISWETPDSSSHRCVEAELQNWETNGRTESSPSMPPQSLQHGSSRNQIESAHPIHGHNC